MPTPITELLSRTIYNTDGVTTVWNFNFAGGYLDKAHVKAYTETPAGLRTYLTVVATDVIGPSQLQITPSPVAGNYLVIYRATPRNLPIVDFTDGSGLSEVSLDINAKQAVFLAAESQDVVETAPIAQAITAANAAAASANDSSASAGIALSAANAAAASSLAAATSAANAAGATALLASSLSSTSGSSLIGYDSGTLQDVADYTKAFQNYTALRSYTGRAKACLITSKGLYGHFILDPTDTASPDNGGTVIVDGSARRWKRGYTSIPQASWFGATGLGYTDDSVALQLFINAYKGCRLFLTGGTYLCAGITLDGTSYDGTELFTVGAELKLKPDGGGSTFGGAWVGLLIRDCNRVRCDLRWDGNRSAMTATREQIYCMGTAGAVDAEFTSLSFREVQGDGLYIGQKDWGTASNPTRRLTLGSISGHNSTDSGRNLVSVISVVGMTLDYLNSYQIGGVINGVRMPGGIDIEPDYGYQLCEDITLGLVNVTTAGSVGVGVLGKAATNDTTGDWTTKNITIGDFQLHFTSSNSGGAAFTRVFDLNVKGSVYYDIGLRNKGAVIDFASRVKADIKTKGCTIGLNVGPLGTVSNFEINVLSNDFGGSGLRTTSVSSGKFTGRCFGSDGGYTNFGIQTHNEGRTGVNQTNVVYEVDAPYDNVMARAFRNEPGNSVTYVGTYIRNCDFSGYANPPATNDAQIYLENVRGLTDAYAIPGNGSWFTSTYVRNSAPAIGGGKVQLGWVRLTTGTNNTAGVDWAPCYTTTT